MVTGKCGTALGPFALTVRFSNAMTRILHRHSATTLSVDLSTKRRAADFHFIEPTGDVRVISVPMGALERLFRDLSQRLVAEPELFGGNTPTR